MELKGALLYKLSNFVYWPEDAANTDRPFGLCLLGASGLEPVLPRLRGLTVQNRPLHVHLAPFSEDVGPLCQAVYIARDQQPYLSLILSKWADRPLLTMSDIEGFARLGGMIEFNLQRKPVALTINPNRAKRAHIGIAAQLLSLATLIQSPPEPVETP